VFNASIFGIPEKGMDKVDLIKDAREKGIKTGIRYLEAVAKAAAARIERGGKMEIRIRMAKLPSDINLKVSEVGIRFISSRQGKVDVRGPVFIGVRSEID
jgi:O-phosphoseryl-tRNA synthetase